MTQEGHSGLTRDKFTQWTAEWGLGSADLSPISPLTSIVYIVLYFKKKLKKNIFRFVCLLSPQKQHSFTLSLISYIGISISIVALSLSFLTFTFLR